MIPRPLRNNNPGDLEAGDHWQGLMPVAQLTEQQKHERFAVFSAPEWGFRAFAVLLCNYKKLYNCNTVRKIVNRFAPPNENPTAGYAEAVAHDVGVHPDDVIDPTEGVTLFALIKSMTKFETGSWEPYWHDAQLAQGLALANHGLAVA